jgi:hypothetical protein
MNNPNSSAEQQDVNTCNTAPRKFGPCTAASVMSFLYNRMGKMDADELRFLSRASETACHMATNLASTVSGIGCLVSWDEQEGKLQAGNFRSGSDEVSALLFNISEQIAVIGEMANIGSEAAFSLSQMGAEHV